MKISLVYVNKREKGYLCFLFYGRIFWGLVIVLSKVILFVSDRVY